MVSTVATQKEDARFADLHKMIKCHVREAACGGVFWLDETQPCTATALKKLMVF